LAHFIQTHSAPIAEVWVVDPNRGNRAAFHKHMALAGFAMSEQVLDLSASLDAPAYRGRMLTYSRN
jgi:hypothetical protein